MPCDPYLVHTNTEHVTGNYKFPSYLITNGINIVVAGPTNLLSWQSIIIGNQGWTLSIFTESMALIAFHHELMIADFMN